MTESRGILSRSRKSVPTNALKKSSCFSPCLYVEAKATKDWNNVHGPRATAVGTWNGCFNPFFLPEHGYRHAKPWHVYQKNKKPNLKILEKTGGGGTKNQTYGEEVVISNSIRWPDVRQSWSPRPRDDHRCIPSNPGKPFFEDSGRPGADLLGRPGWTNWQHEQNLQMSEWRHGKTSKWIKWLKRTIQQPWTTWKRVTKTSNNYIPGIYTRSIVGNKSTHWIQRTINIRSANETHQNKQGISNQTKIIYSLL